MTNDKDELRDRVEQLEQTVQQQQNTIKKMLPNRRQALKGVGLLAGGGLLGAAGGSASAATGTHDVGVPGDRSTLYAAEVLDDNDTKLIDFPNGGPVEMPQGLSTESTIIGSGDTINQIEFGSVSLTPSAAPDDGWDTRDVQETTVTFSSEFSVTPNIIVNPRNPELQGGHRSESTTEFTLRLFNYTTTDFGSITVNWVAVG